LLGQRSHSAVGHGLALWAFALTAATKSPNVCKNNHPCSPSSLGELLIKTLVRFQLKTGSFSLHKVLVVFLLPGLVFSYTIFGFILSS
jgi:hypothetical protein